MTPAASKKALRLGIVGGGRIAAQHLEVLAAMPGVTVEGITSRSRGPAEALAVRFKIPAVFDELPHMVREARPDALLILVSAASIYEVALAAIEHRLPLFIEKPAGLVPADTGRLAERARQLGVATMVGYNRRYYSVFQEGLAVIRRHGPLLGLIVEGHERIGAVRATGRHPEAVLAAWLYANSTHTIDLLRYFGGEVSRAYCLTHRRQEPAGDQFAAIMEFEGGALGHYASHWLSPGGWRVTLYGQGVSVDFKPLETCRWIDAAGKAHDIAPSAEDQRYKPGFYGQMAAFCALVRGEAPGWPLQDLAGAHRTMLLAEQMAAPAGARATEAVT